MSEYLIAIVLSIITLAVGYFVGQNIAKKNLKDHNEEAERKASEIIKAAQVNAENTKRDKMLEAKEHFLKLKSEFEEDSNNRKNIILQNEQKVKQMQQQAAQLVEQNKRFEVEVETKKAQTDREPSATTDPTIANSIEAAPATTERRGGAGRFRD